MRKSFLDLWRRESWLTRMSLTLGLILAVLCALNIALIVVNGFLGHWDLGRLERWREQQSKALGL